MRQAGRNYNHGRHNCGVFHVLGQLLFTATQIELDLLNQKTHVRAASKVTEQLNTLAFKKFQENPRHVCS